MNTEEILEKIGAEKMVELKIKEKVNKSLREENNKLKAELQEWLNAVGNH